MENSQLMKKSYSRFAIAAAAFLVTAVICQLFNNMVLSRFLPDVIKEGNIFTYLNIIIPEYCIGFPVLFLILLKMDKKAPEKNKFGFGKFIVVFFLITGITGVGALIGFGVNYAIMAPFGYKASNGTTLSNLMMGSSPFWRILTVGILAPIFEELIFRKFLIDRTYKYGEWVAILTSGLMFGLFHGNFSQFFFTVGIGAIFAYVYIRTGKIWYSMIYHMIINLSTSVITITLAGNLDYEKIFKMQEISKQLQANPSDADIMKQFTEISAEVLPSMLLFYGWLGILGLTVLVGIVVWIIVLAKKKIVINKTEEYVEKGMKYAWGNVGMIIFIIATTALFVVNLVTSIMSI